MTQCNFVLFVHAEKLPPQPIQDVFVSVMLSILCMILCVILCSLPMFFIQYYVRKKECIWSTSFSCIWYK